MGRQGFNCTTQSEISKNPFLSNMLSRLLQAAALTPGPLVKHSLVQLHTLFPSSTLSHLPVISSFLGHASLPWASTHQYSPSSLSECHGWPLDTEKATPALRMLGQEKVISNYYYCYNDYYFVHVPLFSYAKAKLFSLSEHVGKTVLNL